MPGSLSMRLAMPPSFFICWIWPRKSSRSKPLPFLSLLAIFWASCWSIFCCASSTRLRTSPMPRMREAMRSGWKGWRASVFSPTPRNLMGLPVMWRMERAAPPRASPSTLVRMTPVRGRASSKARAVLAASWPVMASTTNRVSTGCTASCRRRISAIIASSTCRRPAVSSRSTSWKWRRACSTAARPISTGSWSGRLGKKSTPTSAARVWSWSMAAGRWTSALATRTFFFSRSRRWRASLATVVVLPAPCRPAMRTTAGGWALRFRPSLASPMMWTSSSLTILTKT